MIKTLLDLFFPPLCLECNERTDLAYFCATCWQKSALADPVGRCQHCFQHIEEPFGLCSTCQRSPLLPFPRAIVLDREAPVAKLIRLEEAADALAGFAYYQWLKLEWKVPDFVIPVGRRLIAQKFAALLGVPCLPALHRAGWPFRVERWEVAPNSSLEESQLLLLDDGCTLKQLQLALRAIQEAFPKRVHLLSLLA